MIVALSKPASRYVLGNSCLAYKKHPAVKAHLIQPEAEEGCSGGGVRAMGAGSGEVPLHGATHVLSDAKVSGKK